MDLNWTFKLLGVWIGWWWLLVMLLAVGVEGGGGSACIYQGTTVREGGLCRFVRPRISCVRSKEFLSLGINSVSNRSNELYSQS